MSIKDNIIDIRNKIEAAAAKTDRQNKITLMAVTKMHSSSEILEALESGIEVIGENKAQELLEKYPDIKGKCKIHFIGHLQTNKVKSVIDKVDCIQSVDSYKLAAEIDKCAKKINKVMDILIEVNIGEEDSKFGVKEQDVPDFIDSLSQLNNIRICGLMCVLPVMASEGEEKNILFERMWNLFIDNKDKKLDNISMDILSMGMSGDYECAILHGSNLVRVGTSIFGARNYN